MNHSAPFASLRTASLTHRFQRAVPLFVFPGAVAAALILWSRWVAPPTLVAEAETVEVDVRPKDAGIVAGVEVQSLQPVHAGQTLAHVITTDPRLMAASLAVLRAEIELMTVTMQPALDQQRIALDQERLRLDWMRQRVELAGLRVQWQQAQSELERAGPLHRDGMITDQRYEAMKSVHASLSAQLEAQTELVTKLAPRRHLPLPDTDVPTAGEDRSQHALRAGIAVQEEKLRLLEAQLTPIALTAPIDGIVSAILRRSGETVTAGEPVFRISSPHSERLIGFLRQPLTIEPQVGMTAEVRTRASRQQVGRATIVQVGSLIEDVAPSLLEAMPSNTLTPRGLRVYLSKPENLSLRPGELVSVVLRPVDSR
jgi:multidrug resistance efflux pump